MSEVVLLDVAANVGVELFCHLGDSVVGSANCGRPANSGEWVAERHWLRVHSSVPHHVLSCVVQILLPQLDIHGRRLVAVLEPLCVVAHPRGCVINKVIRNRLAAVPHTLTHYPLKEDLFDVPAHARTHFEPGVENEGAKYVCFEFCQVGGQLVHIQVENGEFGDQETLQFSKRHQFELVVLDNWFVSGGCLRERLLPLPAYFGERWRSGQTPGVVFVFEDAELFRGYCLYAGQPPVCCCHFRLLRGNCSKKHCRCCAYSQHLHTQKVTIVNKNYYAKKLYRLETIWLKIAWNHTVKWLWKGCQKWLVSEQKTYLIFRNYLKLINYKRGR